MSIAVRDYTLSSSKHAFRFAGNSYNIQLIFPVRGYIISIFSHFTRMDFVLSQKQQFSPELKTIKINQAIFITNQGWQQPVGAISIMKMKKMQPGDILPKSRTSLQLLPTKMCVTFFQFKSSPGEASDICFMSQS